MDEQTFMFFIVVVQSWLDTGQNVIGLKTNNVVQESPKFVYLRFHFDLRSGVHLHRINVRVDHVFELIIPLIEVQDKMFLLQNLQEIFLFVHVFQFLNILLDFFLELRKLI